MKLNNGDYLRLSEVSKRVSMSVRTLKKYKHEIGYFQPVRNGPIYMRLSDFEKWMTRSRRIVQEDPIVREILEDLSTAVV